MDCRSFSGISALRRGAIVSGVLEALKNGLRDAADVLTHARGPVEVIGALVPARLRGLRILNEGVAPSRPPARWLSAFATCARR